MTPRVAVVTGSNKGIGFAIVKDLCKKFEGDVFLTARNEERGKAAIEELKKQGLKPKFHLLDIEDDASIKSLATFLKNEYGGLDVLVNNAAIAYKNQDPAPFAEQAENTIRINVFATLNVCKHLFPLLKPHARVVNLSSSLGHLLRIPSEELQQKMKSDKLTVEELCDLMNQFVKAAKDGENESKGWGKSAYSVSKVGITALTFIHHRQFLKDSREDIVINAVHPGFVNTDMSSHKGPLTPEQGAEAAVYLALLPEGCKSPRGEFVWNDKSIRDWTKPL